MRAVLSLLLLGVAGCGGGSALTVTVLDAAPLVLDPSRADGSDLTIRVRYHDADGDLGGGVAEIQDCRAAEVVTRLTLPAIASTAAVEAGVPIEGELDLMVTHVGAIDAPVLAPACAPLGVTSLDPGHVVFCIVLVDAQGTRSPGACTQPLAVTTN